MQGAIRGGLVRAMLIAAVAAGASSNVNAGTYSGLLQPYWYNNALYIFYGGQNASGIPSCSTRSLVRLQETDPNDAVFKAKYAMLLSLWLAGKSVTLVGNGTCSGEGDEWIIQVYPGN